MKTIVFFLATVFLYNVIGQEPSAPVSSSSALVPANINKELSKNDRLNEIVNALKERVWDKSDSANAFLSFLSDWNIRPKLFQTTDDKPGIGLEFDYKKALASHVANPSARNPIGLSLAVEAKGDIAVDSADNPNDLIEAGGSLNLFQGIGGIDPTYRPDPAAQQKLQDYINAAARGDVDARRLAMEEFRTYMRPQFFYDIAGHGKIEADQKFGNRQYVFGGAVGFVFRDWRRKSDVGFFNVFDYPFAVMRSLANQEVFTPSARAFPSFVVGIDQVDPSDNKTRLAVDPDDDPFARLRVEVAFKTPYMKWKDDNLYFRAVYRHFQELGSSTAIRAAELDHSKYFVAVMDLPLNFNLSYSTGKLPLDQKSDNVYAIGWSLNF